MKPFFPVVAIAALTGSMLLPACTPQPSPSSFSAGETMRAVPVQFGTVESARAVEIRPGQTRLGAITGAILGGVGGSQIGRSTAANVAGATAGAVAGGAAGSAIQGSRRTQGVEITIALDSGNMIAVVQPGDVRDFRRGDRVRVSGEGENVRVTR
jgi:outer membrane lipoprotein SlyB